MASLEHSHSHSPSRSSEKFIASSPSTNVTTPDQSPGADDDIWDTSSDHDYPRNDSTTTQDRGLDDGGIAERRPNQILSDLPTLRRQHVTSGYREGLAIGKAQVMQRGFDEGYPFGVELGLRIGAVLGVLEGMLAAFKKAGAASTPAGTAQAATRRSRPGSSSSGTLPSPSSPPDGSAITTAETLAFLTSLYARATAELKISELMKVMDDEKVAKLEAGAALPAEIEAVVKRWEEVVLGTTFREPPPPDVEAGDTGGGGFVRAKE